MIHHGDCIEVMAAMPEASVDAIVTDPPYGLEFMGKHWDAHPSPGAFGEWCEVWGREALRVTKPGGYLLAFGGTRTHHRLVCGLEDAGWIIRDELDWIYASGFPKGKANLKPAHEPIVLARKPGPLQPLNIDECRISTLDALHGSTVRNDIRGGRFGSGHRPNPGDISDYQQDASGRWPSNVLLSDPELFDERNPDIVGSGKVVVSGTSDGFMGEYTPSPSIGAFAHNQLRTEVVYGDSGGYSRFFLIPKADRADREPVLRRSADILARRQNHHPTVKPTDLMRHLIRLVTPSGGTVLDPFLGSGSTAIAAELEGFEWIGIEKEPEYIAIAEARLNGTQRGMGLSA